jgi:hypothetical protein
MKCECRLRCFVMSSRYDCGVLIVDRLACLESREIENPAHSCKVPAKVRGSAKRRADTDAIAPLQLSRVDTRQKVSPPAKSLVETSYCSILGSNTFLSRASRPRPLAYSTPCLRDDLPICLQCGFQILRVSTAQLLYEGAIEEEHELTCIVNRNWGRLLLRG